ncbi:PIG-X [Sphaerosporella brunnea]|uniref:Protein PBN1 n=1 Tax=Sphaerosporella brunnea TaxID=1250544 RepID=A0A5J5EVH6_9PEZI|nr:PIG-X [Sphaerosporella brunnea]
MKQRTTYLVSSPEYTHPDNFELSPESLHIKTLHAAREDRLTIGYNELPPELWNVLKQCNEVFIRWSTGKPYESVDPFGSRVPAGLHVFLKPQREALPFHHRSSICTLLNDAFGLNKDECKGFEESFVEIPGGYQFYSPLKSIEQFESFVEKLLCKTDYCRARVAPLGSADYIDLKYDAVSQTLVANSFWSRPEQPWQETVKSVEGHKNIEVGVLGNDPPIAPESLTMGGVLHVVAKDDKLEPVMFTFPSRHHRSLGSFTLTTPLPTGLHPKLELAISPSGSPLKPPSEDCTLNAYFTLPKALFVDKYQLSTANPQLLKSLNLKRLRNVSGETDLEAPVWGVTRWGSSILVELDEAGSTFELPLHLRYLEPRNGTDQAQVSFASPSVFWACKSEEWSMMSNNPFDRSHLGWEHLFPEQTMYYHLSPATGEEAWKTVDVPVLDLRYAGIVKVGTVVVVLGGFFWVCWKVFSSFAAANKEEEVKKTQ